MISVEWKFDSMAFCSSAIFVLQVSFTGNFTSFWYKFTYIKMMHFVSNFTGFPVEKDLTVGQDFTFDFTLLTTCRTIFWDTMYKRLPSQSILWLIVSNATLMFHYVHRTTRNWLYGCELSTLLKLAIVLFHVSMKNGKHMPLTSQSLMCYSAYLCHTSE